MPHLILYDGVCGLCNRLNSFVLKRDARDQFRYAALQGPVAAEVLKRHGRVMNLNAVVVAVNHGQPDEALLERARAVLFILERLGGIWSVARIFRLAPAPLLNAFYNGVARIRYRVFGKHETCPVPATSHRVKFLDL